MHIEKVYSNRRREHIHIIRQYIIETKEYTGTRLVVFMKNDVKYITDYGDFIKHKYKNPKSKVNRNSLWKVIDSGIENVIAKEMYNTDEEGKLQMHHILYESTEIPLAKYYNIVLEKEGLHLDESKESFLTIK